MRVGPTRHFGERREESRYTGATVEDSPWYKTTDVHGSTDYPVRLLPRGREDVLREDTSDVPVVRVLRRYQKSTQNRTQGIFCVLLRPVSDSQKCKNKNSVSMCGHRICGFINIVKLFFLVSARGRGLSGRRRRHARGVGLPAVVAVEVRGKTTVPNSGRLLRGGVRAGPSQGIP